MRSQDSVFDRNSSRVAACLLMCSLLGLSACRATPSAVTPADGPNVSTTIATAVQATLQTQQVIRTAAAATDDRLSTTTVSTPAPTLTLDEAFTGSPRGWPNTPQGPARYADGVYQLAPQVFGQFVAINAPLTRPVRDVSVSGRFHKSGGPAGGGYGLIVNDQSSELRDAVDQGGRFVVLEVGDDGRVGAWQREQNRWIDLLAWTPNPAVHKGTAPNDLTVRAQSGQLTFVVNGSQVAQLRTELVEGRVGVFVGGDDNQVVLDRFAVLSPASGTAGARWPPQPTATPSSVDLLARLDAAWSHSDWPQAFTLLDQLERTDPTALDFQDKRYVAHMATGQDLLTKGNKDAALVEFIRADALDPSRSEAKVALLALTPTPTPLPLTPTPVPAPTSAPPPNTPNVGSGPVPIGVVLKPAEQAAAAVYGITTPWGGPVAVGVVTLTRSNVRVPIILDGDRYLYAYDCATGRCQGFTVDIWQSLLRAQKQAYLDRVLDALRVALPNQSPTVLVDGRSKTNGVRVRVTIVAGQRTYEGL